MSAAEVLLLLGRLVLAGAFAAAAVGKLLDPAGTRRAVTEFGAPAASVGFAAAALPFAELALAIGLLPTPTAWLAGIGALGLLGLFLAAMSYNLAKGRAPDCHCFGQFHSAPIGPRTIALNLALCAIAGALVWFGRFDVGPSLIAWAAPLTIAERGGLILGVAALGALAALGFLMWQVLAQQGRMLLRLEAIEARLNGDAPAQPTAAYNPDHGAGLPVGSPAPDFILDSLGGGRVALAELLAVGEPIILLFTNPSCGPCEALLPQIAAWRREFSSPRIVLIAEGDPEHYGATLQADPNHPVLGETGRRTAELYEVWGTPSALLVDAEGMIVTRAAGGSDAIRGLVAWATGAAGAPGAFAIEQRHRDASPPMPPPGLPIGQPAPTLLLDDLDGAVVDLAETQGRPTMLLFWNPGCGFCQQMLSDLQDWDERRGPEAPEILVISSGGAEESAAMRLRSRILLDDGFRAGPLFGAHGTPMAVLIDELGAVASQVAAGKDAVLELAGAFA